MAHGGGGPDPALKHPPWPRFAGYAFLALFVPAVLGGSLFLQAFNHERELVALQQQHDLQIRKTAIESHLRQLGYSLIFLADQVHLHQPLSDPEGRRIFAEDMLSFLNTTELFDQLRLLDLNGKEVARANYNRGHPFLVPEEQLQDKSRRYYFQHSIRLDPGDMYVSPLDLNVEHGEIERPFKPTIRFCMPVSNKAGQKIGLLVMNYLADHLLALVKSRQRTPVYMLNAHGDWFIAPDPAWTWGHMLPERERFNMGRMQAEAWNRIRQTDGGHFLIGDTHYVFTTIYPIKVLSGIRSLSLSSDPASMQWKMLIMYSNDMVLKQTADLQRSILVWSAGLAIALLFGAWFYANIVEQNQQHAVKLRFLADHDALTGLLSRRRLFEQLQMAMARSRRYKTPFALLYLDLDRFKPINDQHGHEAGDQVLREIAGRLLACVREVDIVARLGGDEFAIILDQLKSRSDAAAVAEKLIESINRPIVIHGRKHEIGCSIGIAIYPDDAEEPDALLARADEAMYRAKRRGKNHYEFVS